MIKRGIILLSALLIAIISLFMPYEVQIYEDIDTGGRLIQENISQSGIELIAPLFSIVAYTIIFFLIAAVRHKAANIIAFILTCFSGVFLFLIYFLIHFQLFGTLEIHTGLGFYLLVFATLVYFGVTLYTLIKPNNRIRKSVPNDILDMD